MSEDRTQLAAGRATAGLAGCFTVLCLLLPIGLLAACYFQEGLFLHRSIVDGDALVHGYPVLTYHHAVMRGDYSMFWSDLIFGGHPVFAESQFAFLSPLNIVVAGLFTPIYGQTVFHFLCLVLSATGMIVLCRFMGFSRSASIFAAAALAFSGLWLQVQQNLTISGSIMLIPWALWAAERWLKSPTSYIPLAVVMTLLVYAGYPQVLHGTAIYMAISLLGNIFCSRERSAVVSAWRDYLRYGSLAVAVCIGLSAVQLIPMMELYFHSFRSDGVDYISPPADSLVRGMLYYQSKGDPWNRADDYFAGAGSLLVCAVASMFVFTKPGGRILGHAMASAVLFNLALGHGSSLFALLYDNHLLPGIDAFRTMWIYLAMAIVGISLIAASAIDSLARQRSNPLFYMCILSLIATWAGVVSINFDDWLIKGQIIIALSGIVFSTFLILWRRPQLIGALLSTLIMVEIISIKVASTRFVDNAALQQPSTVSYLKNTADLDDYSTISFETSYLAFASPSNPKLAELAEKTLSAMRPSTNLLWGIESFGGAHALQLHRRQLLEDVVTEELGAKTRTDTHGYRTADYFSLRYLLLPPAMARDLEVDISYSDPETGVLVADNVAARPRFQTYTAWQWVDDPEAALQILRSHDTRRLLVERLRPDQPVNTPDSAGENDASAITYKLLSASATRYTLVIDAKRPGWFFIADANYPGWTAWLNGERTDIYSAQILGKAVSIPAGQHSLVVRFVPYSFFAGLAISVATILGMLVSAAIARRDNGGIRLVATGKHPY